MKTSNMRCLRRPASFPHLGAVEVGRISEGLIVQFG